MRARHQGRPKWLGARRKRTLLGKVHPRAMLKQLNLRNTNAVVVRLLSHDIGTNLKISGEIEDA